MGKGSKEERSLSILFHLFFFLAADLACPPPPLFPSVKKIRDTQSEEREREERKNTPVDRVSRRRGGGAVEEGLLEREERVFCQLCERVYSRWFLAHIEPCLPPPSRSGPAPGPSEGTTVAEKEEQRVTVVRGVVEEDR